MRTRVKPPTGGRQYALKFRHASHLPLTASRRD